MRISSVVSKYRNTRWPLVLLVLMLGSSRSDCQQVQSDESDAKYDVVSIKRATDCKETGDGPRFGVTVSPERLRIDCQTTEFFIRQAFLTAGADMMQAPRQFLQPFNGFAGLGHRGSVPAGCQSHPPASTSTNARSDASGCTSRTISHQGSS